MKKISKSIFFREIKSIPFMVELIRSTRSRMSDLTRSTSTSVTDLVEEGQGDEPLRLLDEDLEFFGKKYQNYYFLNLNVLTHSFTQFLKSLKN